MARKAKTPPRDAGGRFVKRREASSSATPAGHATHTGAGRRGIGQLAVLSLAMVTGVTGLAFGVFWVASLILMGILWGAMAMERQRQPGAVKGLVAEVVDVVVDEAKGVAESASRHNGSHNGSDLNETPK